MPENPSAKANSEIIENYDSNGNILKLKRTGNRQKGQVKMIDDLTYTVEGNHITSVTDGTNNLSGYEGGGGSIGYDDNGNMTSMADKGITGISYNFLNLAEQINQTNVTTYQYRADGVKVKKKFVLNNEAGSNTINTEYIDGFVYTTPKIEAIGRALQMPDPSTVGVAHAREEEAYIAPREGIIPDNPGISVSLAYFPTAEGYYDYQNNKYIYHYKDHLGNVRLSYAKNSAGVLEILDRNDYFPFGMNIYTQTSVYGATGTPLNNKYNQKELQETGFYDYGWRQYMPDLGRWFGMDKLSETYSSTSPYAYVLNNPINMFDPDGRVTNDWLNGFYNASGSGSTTWTNTGDGFTSGSSYSNGMTGHFSYGGEFTMSNMIQGVVIQGRGNASNWNSSVNHAFNSLSLMSGIMGAQANWNGQQARSRLHEAMGDNIADDVQGMLDGFGTIPILGEAADGMSGLISLGRGNKAQAALSFGAMIPILGWGAVGMKYGDKMIAINKLTEGGGLLLNGTPSSAINSAMYYEKASEQGASIFRSISGGHMFIDGNKRTAVGVFQNFAKQAGLETVSHQQMMNVATQVATGQITDISQIARMLIK